MEIFFAHTDVDTLISIIPFKVLYIKYDNA